MSYPERLFVSKVYDDEKATDEIFHECIDCCGRVHLMMQAKEAAPAAGVACDSCRAFNIMQVVCMEKKSPWSVGAYLKVTRCARSDLQLKDCCVDCARHSFFEPRKDAAAAAAEDAKEVTDKGKTRLFELASMHIESEDGPPRLSPTVQFIANKVGVFIWRVSFNGAYVLDVRLVSCKDGAFELQMQKLMRGGASGKKRKA